MASISQRMQVCSGVSGDVGLCLRQILVRKGQNAIKTEKKCEKIKKMLAGDVTSPYMIRMTE